MYAWVFDIVKYTSQMSISSGVKRRVMCPLMSTPISRQTVTAFSAGRSPSTAERPALWHMMFSNPRCSMSWRKMPSAIGLLHVLPVQTNSIFIFVLYLLLW